MSIDDENSGTHKECLFCNQPFSKKSKKEFCSKDCREYYFQIHKEDSLKKINQILKRNWEILKEVLGKNTVIEIDILALQLKDFNFCFHTHHKITANGKGVFYCYDYSFSVNGSMCVVSIE
jgi:predicted nucleic acid-binding Zn ribbon protein